ncbi:hypothetical protein MCEMSE15_02789 [Fimbriimonadaceae bacterium]
MVTIKANKALSGFLLAGILALTGCQLQNRITGQRELDRTEALLRAAWLNANEEALRLSAASSLQAKIVARDELVDLQAQIANTRKPKSMDNLRLAYVEEHIAKLDAAIQVDEAKQQLDRRLKEAKSWPENLKKSSAQVRQILEKTDDQVQSLMAEIEEGQSNYKAAENTMNEIWGRLKTAGAILPNSKSGQDKQK